MTRNEITLAKLGQEKQILKDALENFISVNVTKFQKATNIPIESIKVKLHESIPSYYVVELETNIDKIL